jgi:hypothetical protein
MEDTNSFIALETMVRQGWFWKRHEEFELLLDLFEKKNLITITEHQALLDLAKQFSVDGRDQNDGRSGG